MTFSSWHRVLLTLVALGLQIPRSLQHGDEAEEDTHSGSVPSEYPEPLRLEGGCSDYLNELTVTEDVITYRWTINANSLDASKSTIRFQYTYVGEGWIGFGLQETPGEMIGGEAVIGVPQDGSVQKYNLNGHSLGQVVPMPEDKQTLMDTSIVQDGSGTTVLSFTKYLSEEGQMPIKTEGLTYAMGAVGVSNTLAAHAPNGRGSVAVPFTPDCIDGVLVEKKGVTDKNGSSGTVALTNHYFPILLSLVVVAVASSLASL